MKNSKALLSILMVYVMIVVSIAPTFAVIAPEDSASGVSQAGKIDSVLVEKMASASENELIPVWVWMTDIDTDRLDAEIEAKTGVSQQKLDTARADMGLDVSSIKASANSANSSLLTYLEDTKEQRTKIANDTKIYFDAKKQLASRYYTTANTSKIRQLGVASNRIDFQSKLTPTFVAYLTKDEITEIATSTNVLEVGYFSEYDEEYEAPTESQNAQTSSVNEESTEPPTEYPTIDVSTLHTGVKEELHHDDALQKYGVTGDGIKILHVDHNYVRRDSYNNYLIPNWSKIKQILRTSSGDTVIRDASVIGELPVEDPTDDDGLTNNHANLTVSYMQAFAKDALIYSVAKPSSYGGYNNENDPDINGYDLIEDAITELHVDLINASCNDGTDAYQSSFSARWYDAIVAMYNIPLIASAGNAKKFYPDPIAPSSGYNSIAVGVCRYSNNRMPDNYTFVQSTDDTTRVTYKPDLIVPMDSFLANGRSYFGATSAGAPVVSAIVAMMMELDPSLKSQPQIIKAILMASCHEKAMRSTQDEIDNVPQEEMINGLTPKQGAGKVNALRALDIVAYGTYGYSSIFPDQNSNNIYTIHLNSQVKTDEEKYPLNVSIAWLRDNRKTSNNESENAIQLGTYYDLCMSVYHADQAATDRKTSAVYNSAKQMVYIPEPEWGKDYRVRVYWRDNQTTRGGVIIGYAYSVGDFEKVIDKVEISGPVAVGQTLTATAYTNDDMLAQSQALSYFWYSSSDSNSWQIITGANSNTYTITESDLNKNLICVVCQDYLSDHEIEVKTPTAVVRLGDVDNDGYINMFDVTIMQRYIQGNENFTPEQMVSADLNGDGNVDSVDCDILQQYCSGTINQFPVENNG